MESCPKNSCHNFPWQANLERILTNLKDEFLIATNTNVPRPPPAPKQLTTEALFMLYIILIFVILVIIGSSVDAIEMFFTKFGKKIISLVISGKVESADTGDVAKKSLDPSVYTDVWGKCKNCLECFAIQRNCRRLLSTADNGEENLKFLSGVKTIALLWIMIPHTSMFYASILSRVSADFQYVLEMPLTQLMLNGIFANDVYFVLSGFLNGYLFLDYYKKNDGKIPWLLYYVGRILRFTPLYLIILGFYATLFSYIDSGPIWPTYQTNPICKENWIWNVLYLNNFLKHNEQCMLTTWYIACDLQLYIISPLFLLLLIKRTRTAFVLIIACNFGSSLLSYVLTKRYNLIDGASKLAIYNHDMRAFYGRFWTYFDTIYDKPFSRIGIYLIGMSLGYYVFHRKSSGVKKSSLVTLWIGWLMCVTFFLIAFFAIFNRDESLEERALYNAVKHILFSCSTAWIFFVCVTGQGGFINRFLSHPIFVPFSRLSYSIYFTNIIAIEKYFLSIDQLVVFSPSVVLLQIRLALWTLVAAFFVSLIFERPLLNLAGLLMKPSKPEKKVQ